MSCAMLCHMTAASHDVLPGGGAGGAVPRAGGLQSRRIASAILGGKHSSSLASRGRPNNGPLSTIVFTSFLKVASKRRYFCKYAAGSVYPTSRAVERSTGTHSIVASGPLLCTGMSIHARPFCLGFKSAPEIKQRYPCILSAASTSFACRFEAHSLLRTCFVAQRAEATAPLLLL